MKHKKNLLLLILGLFIWKAAFAERWQCLKNIDEIHLGIGYLSEDAKKIGLSPNRLRTVTESKLRKEGIN